MNDTATLTAEQFGVTRFDLPDSGRWTELVRGKVVTLAPPEPDHGTIVLNLGKEFAGYFQRHRVGYACFDLGLTLSRSPDTVRFPAVSLFLGHVDFAESDRDITDSIPDLVVEVGSSPVRRRTMSDRVTELLAMGVRQVWVIDPAARSVDVLESTRPREHLLAARVLESANLLPGFGMQVEDLFVEPSWWK